ncbi:MAG: xanthine dehydrogenase family protein molybdopterin-binding subunit [Pseudomonadota bacterium]
MKFGVGQSITRVEDPALLRGEGTYTGDLAPPDAARMAVVRSPFASGIFALTGIDDARAMPGVLAVVTADEVTDLGPLPCLVPVKERGGEGMTIYPNPVLPKDRVRYVGEALAAVIAETEAQARDAVEAIGFDFDEADVAVDLKSAIAEDAALVYPQHGSNIAFDWELGDKDKTETALAEATHVIELELINNRVVTNYLEPRGAVGSYNPETGRYGLITGSQGAHLMRNLLADKIFNVPREQIHVRTPDTGGGFGTRFFMYREYPLTLVGAKLTGRSVWWNGDRTEHFLGDYQGRDHVSWARLALDAKGKVLALDVDTLANMGAYISQLGPFIPTNGAFMNPGVYDIPAIYTRVRGVYTHTVPLDAYRGAGRPEAAYLIERLVDKAAREIGMKPEVFRKRNFVKPRAMPYETATGRVYDTGEFLGHMERAMDLADWSGFRKRQAASRKAGKLRGIGMATYIEACSGGGAERAVVTLDDTGKVTVLIGSQSTGQGHATAYAQLVSEHLDIGIDQVTVVQGDTDRIATGSGTGGSRSIPVGGASVAGASRMLADRIRELAADKLEAAAADLELANGAIRIAGTDRELTLGEIAASQPDQSLSAEDAWTPPAATYPNGTHIAEVEIDRDTGKAEVVGYVVVDDFGVTLNPLLLLGQIHGGIAQGLGQALLERTVYDTDTGQLLTASFQDYCMPRADDMPPDIVFETRNVPSTTNILGMKGAGEAGAIGASPAVTNAVVDALHRVHGVTHIDMPTTQEAIWRVIQAAERGEAA